MKMGCQKTRITITSLILIFIFFIFSDAYPLKTHYQEDMFKQLMKEGEDLYKNGALERAVVVFTMALTYAETNQEYVLVYWNLSLVHFYNSQIEETMENLRKLFEIQPDIEIDESLYEPRFIEIFNNIKTEGPKQQIKEEDKEPVKYEIQKEPTVQTVPLKKEKLKKRRRIPFVAIIGTVVAVSALAVYLALPKTGEIEIKSYPPGANIYLDNDDVGQKSNYTITDLKPGEYSVKLLKDGYGDFIKKITVQAGKTAEVTANLSPHTISITQPTSGTDWTQGDTVTIKWNTGGGLAQTGLNSMFRAQFSTQNSLPSDQSGTGKNRDASNRLNGREGQSRGADRISRSQSSESSGLLQERFMKDRALRDSRMRNQGTTALENKNNPSVHSWMFYPNTEVELQTLSLIKIDLLRNNILELNITPSAPNSGSFSWTIPNTLPDSSHYKIKISCSTDDNVYGQSAEFTISANVGKIQVNSTPTGADIWLDNLNTGYITNHLLQNVPVGSHSVKLIKERYQDWEGSVSVSKNVTSTINAPLKVGAFTEDFNDGVADHFIESHDALWTVSSGVYVFQGNSTNVWSTSRYNLGEFSDFTLTVRGNRETYQTKWGLAFRGNSDFSTYYIFYLEPWGTTGKWGVWKVTGPSSSLTIKGYTSSTAINTGTNQWNKLKIVAQGSDFTLYINDVFVDTVTISGVPSQGKIGLVSWTGYTKVKFDDVTLTLPGTAPLQTKTTNVLEPRPGPDPNAKK